jgi:hypothetical protein
MTFTYDLTTSIGKVRLLIPDNDATAYDLEDDEITYMLTEVGNEVKAAAVKCCKWLARKYAKKATFSADGLSMQNGDRAKTFAERARELEQEASGAFGTIDMTRDDGYADAAQDTEYDSRIVYIIT